MGENHRCRLTGKKNQIPRSPSGAGSLIGLTCKLPNKFRDCAALDFFVAGFVEFPSVSGGLAEERWLIVRILPLPVAI